ncbi:sterol desaturase family protein [Sphingomonas sp.]|uniref:sterol desaturase family protein n=1 Tax=Sphingomonas sp. TaxID=28214 RepID=UPI003D6D7243
MIETLIEIIWTFATHWFSGFQEELIRYLVAAAGVTAILWLARRSIASRRIQQRMATMADRRREIFQSIRTVAIFPFVGLLTVGAVALGLGRVDFGPPDPLILIIQVIVIILAHDTYFYWMHRMLHLRAMFRRAHAAHHSSRTPTSWAAYSFAPIESVTEALFGPIILIAMSWIVPIYPIAGLFFAGHQMIRNVLGHSGHELAWSGFTRSRWTGWLTTTTHHDLHHSEGRYNFGIYFTWWDRMMGTEHPRYHEKFEAVVSRGKTSTDPVTA